MKEWLIALGSHTLETDSPTEGHTEHSLYPHLCVCVCVCAVQKQLSLSLTISAGLLPWLQYPLSSFEDVEEKY